MTRSTAPFRPPSFVHRVDPGVWWVLGVALVGLVLLGCGFRGARAETTEDPPAWSEVQPGTFRMGAPAAESCRRDEPVAKEVTVSAGFEVAPYEVTQAEFEHLMGYNPSFGAVACPTCPVDSVSWHEAAAFATAMSDADGLHACYACQGRGKDVLCQRTAKCDGYRLPTPTEWEYAARAGTKGGTYAGAITSCMSHDDVGDEIGWFKSNSGGQSQPVGAKEPNKWGLYDVAGNVYEWTDDQTPNAEQEVRGGSWYHNSHHLRAASRLVVAKDMHLSYAGFRLVRTLDRGSDR